MTTTFVSHFKHLAALAALRRSPVSICTRWLTKQIDFERAASSARFRDREGLSYALDLNDHVMRQLFLHGRYEANTQRHLFSYLTPDMTFVDVGANIGAYTLPVAKRLAEGCVVAFEPNPPAFELLRSNVANNHLGNVRVVTCGLSDHPGLHTLHGDGLTTASLHKHHGQNSTQISVTTLDLYLHQEGITRADVLKIDVEGHEMSVLRGATDLLASEHPMMLIVEIDDNCEHAGHTRNELFEFIRGFGFTAHLPRAWPLGLELVNELPNSYTDNVVFLRQDRPSSRW